MGEPQSKARIYIDYSGGNYQLKRVKSCDVSFEAKLEVVKAVGVNNGAGFREENGGGELTFEVYREDVPEVSYRKLYLSKERFGVTIQDGMPGQVGVREQYRSCRVEAPPGRKIDEAGNMMDTVKLKFLDFGEL
jgi:hypothetical protein